MTTEVIDERYYINVASKMVEKGLAFQRPRLRRKVVYDKVDGFRPDREHQHRSDAMTRKSVYYDGQFITLPKYIYRNRRGRFEIRKAIGGTLMYWGSFKTLEEAKLYLAYYIGKKWRVNPHFRNRESRYIVEQNGSFLIRKRQNGRLVCFGTFNNFDDAKTERDVCEACNWDMDCIVEFGDTIQDEGCVVYG